MSKLSFLAKKEKVLPENNERTFRAQVMCSGTCNLAERKYINDSVHDCLSLAYLAGGDKKCTYGCLGQGDCVKVCKENAIRIVNGIAAVEYEKCTACGKCVEVCPKNIIKLVPYSAQCWVGCMSSDDAQVTKINCKVGCIGCRVCLDICTKGAISIEKGKARIDYSICDGCGRCAAECPRKIIWQSKTE